MPRGCADNQAVPRRPWTLAMLTIAGVLLAGAGAQASTPALLDLRELRVDRACVGGDSQASAPASRDADVVRMSATHWQGDSQASAPASRDPQVMSAGQGGSLLPSRAEQASDGPLQDGDPMDPLLADAIGYYTGAAGTVDDARARDLLLEAADDGDTLSVMWMARVYSRGRMLFERDEARAGEIAAGVLDAVREFAEWHHEAAFLMGTAYAEALGVEENQPLAIAWYHRAADLGNMLAQHNLGNAYREGNHVVEDLGMAAYWYHQAAAQGDALPMYWLGQFYERGEGVAADREQALHWYRESAARGRADAREALRRIGG